MTIKEFMKNNKIAHVLLEYRGLGDDGGFDWAWCYDDAGVLLELNPLERVWIERCADCADDGCLDIYEDYEGGGAQVDIHYDSKLITFTGNIYHHEKESNLQGKYEGTVEPDTLAEITGEKTYFSDVEVFYKYYGDDDCFREMALIEGPDEVWDYDAFFHAFFDEFPSFNNEGGHGTIALNLHTGDYSHKAYRLRVLQVVDKLTTGQINWFQTYDAEA